MKSNFIIVSFILVISPFASEACNGRSEKTSKISTFQASDVSRGRTTFDNQIRLSGSGGSYGFVEVLYNNQWGTICDESLSADPCLGPITAETICRFLGQPGPAVWFSVDAANIPSDFSGVQQSTTSQIWLESFYCFGTESNVDQCQHAPPGHKRNDCPTSQNLGVACNYQEDAPVYVFVSLFHNFKFLFY